MEIWYSYKIKTSISFPPKQIWMCFAFGIGFKCCKAKRQRDFAGRSKCNSQQVYPIRKASIFSEHPKRLSLCFIRCYQSIHNHVHAIHFSFHNCERFLDTFIQLRPLYTMPGTQEIFISCGIDVDFWRLRKGKLSLQWKLTNLRSFHSLKLWIYIHEMFVQSTFNSFHLNLILLLHLAFKYG